MVALYPVGERFAREILDCLSFALGTNGIKLCIQNNLAAVLTLKADICRTARKQPISQVEIIE